MLTFLISALACCDRVRHYGQVTESAEEISDPTPTSKQPGARARVRAQLTAEIKALARQQLAVDGASALSLRAIARDMDMASSAIYRYFASRDDLLTALIVDAYDSIGSVVEEASMAPAQHDYAGRFVAIATAIRDWARANPHEYALIYGSPVPGYAAPEATIDPATRVPTALITVLVEARAGQQPEPPESAALAGALAQLSEFVGHMVPPSVLAKGVRAWGEVFGLVSLELFGHFNNAITDPGVFFDHAIRELAERTLES